MSVWPLWRATSLLLLLCAIYPLPTQSIIVQDTDTGINFDSTWSLDGNPSNSGGFAHRTNITGGTASYSFYGSDISMYGVTHLSGANFIFTVDGTNTKNCTCHVGVDVWSFWQLVCEIGNLDPSAAHNLVVKHNDVDGQWVNLDYLQIINFTSTTTSQTLSSSTSTSTPSTPKSSHPSHVAAIAGGVGGGVGGLIIVGILLLLMRSRKESSRHTIASATETTARPSQAQSSVEKQSAEAGYGSIFPSPQHTAGSPFHAYGNGYSGVPELDGQGTRPGAFPDTGFTTPGYSRVDRNHQIPEI
ncbi:hypothetical protein DL93DRAFT_2233967 [Clavulina sp. PMI_390]|nr:hypothetical protein DL93DRAFT_2233967 [Clavulina sp. PMI_390]